VFEKLPLQGKGHEKQRVREVVGVVKFPPMVRKERGCDK